ncbi:Protein LIFEGUARD 2 [Orobanche hederae]
MMFESPELRWSFIRKIYTMVSLQLLLTIAVGAIVVGVHPISRFFVSTGAGLALYIVLIITPFIVLCPLYYYHQRHPLNYFLLGLFTLSLAFAVGLTCAFTSGNLIDYWHLLIAYGRDLHSTRQVNLDIREVVFKEIIDTLSA